jgi:hypothetical protein
MKHLLLALVLSCAALAGCSPALQPPAAQSPVAQPPTGSSNVFRGTPGVARDPRGPDLDCADFASQDEAQDFFEASGGVTKDPHQLDADNDGIACERDETWGSGGTGGGGSTVTPPPPSNNGQCWVNGYYRKDGTYVRGYWRRC